MMNIFFSEIVVEIYCNMANLKMQTVCKKSFDFAGKNREKFDDFFFSIFPFEFLVNFSSEFRNIVFQTSLTNQFNGYEARYRRRPRLKGDRREPMGE